ELEPPPESTKGAQAGRSLQSAFIDGNVVPGPTVGAAGQASAVLDEIRHGSISGLKSTKVRESSACWHPAQAEELKNKFASCNDPIYGSTIRRRSPLWSLGLSRPATNWPRGARALRRSARSPPPLRAIPPDSGSPFSQRCIRPSWA